MASSRLERIGTIFTRVEGLLKKGAMKLDERPIWFDIYKAFPPIDEPRYARSTTELKPLRPILYQEDIIRAKFHGRKHGIGLVNMLNASGDTPTKKLLRQYEKLKTEGLTEDEAIEKCVEIIQSERQQIAIEREASLTQKSLTSQILDEANMKNVDAK